MLTLCSETSPSFSALEAIWRRIRFETDLDFESALHPLNPTGKRFPLRRSSRPCDLWGAELIHTVLRSVMTLTIQPAPAISTSFSCQLSSTLIACPPPSPPPLECIWEKPVGCGDRARVEAEEGWELCDIPLYLYSKSINNGLFAIGRRAAKGAYKYFIKTSSSSVPPSEPYILLSMGDMSDCFVDCRISTTVARCTSCSHS